MSTVKISIRKDQDRDTAAVFTCDVVDGCAATGAFDFVASKDFLSLSEQEIIEQVIYSDDFATDILRDALNDGGVIVLNDGDPLSPDSVRAAIEAIYGQDDPKPVDVPGADFIASPGP